MIPPDESDISPRGAIMGFAAWLTMRPTLVVGRSHDVGELLELVRTYCDHQGFAEVEDGWENHIKAGAGGV